MPKIKLDSRKIKNEYQKPTEKVAIGEGWCVVQCFGQIPLYSMLDDFDLDLDLEYQTDKIGPNGSINLLDLDVRTQMNVLLSSGYVLYL
ncbi:hypothetical protein C4E24_06990 [ANME-1 cluster archaeon AG-394-G21]|nr:hypothetical protein [ANME-1 cluster archaeon AG-394-G21]